MTLYELAVHLADIPRTCDTLLTNELDFSTAEGSPVSINSLEDLLSTLDKNVANAMSVLENTNDKDFIDTWTLRDGTEIFFCTSQDGSDTNLVV